MTSIEACTPTHHCVRATATGEQSEVRLLKAVGLAAGIFGTALFIAWALKSSNPQQ